MRTQRTVLTLLFAGMLAWATGCARSESSLPVETMTPYVLSADTIARVHWLGEERLGVAASSYYLMHLWLLPASAKLQAQTLDKLSTAPWRRSAGGTAVTNAAGALRPLLGDVVWNESYLEIHQPANQPVEFVFAIRLKAEQADFWQTNLASVFKSLTGASPAALSTDPAGWTLKPPGTPNLIRLIRAGDWTIVSEARDGHSLVDGVLNWIRDDPVPAFGAGTNDWLEADLDLPRLAPVLLPAWHPPPDLPVVSLAVNGDGARVLTRCRLTFPQALPLQLQSWNFPSNLLHDPLDSLTAVRGVKPWLASLKTWHNLPLDPLPDQLYFWALPGAPSEAYFAIPLPDASNQANRLTGYLLQKSNPWLAAHGYVQLERLPDADGVSWGNMPSIRPFFESVNAAQGGVIFGGLLPDPAPGTNTQDNLYERPALTRLFGQISAQPNLVYYDWELTGSRIEPCLYLGQISRVISRHVQLPLNAVSADWLKMIEPKLGSSTTLITRTGTNQLSFFRKSTVGFTGAELQLLADWLESPQFPCGLYSLLTPPPSSP